MQMIPGREMVQIGNLSVTVLTSFVPASASANGQVLELPTQDYYLERWDERAPGSAYIAYYSAKEKKRRTEIRGLTTWCWIMDYENKKIFTVHFGTPARYRVSPFTGDERRYVQTG